MMKFNNEKGITLVEVLVVFLISSIVGAILYSIVILTMNYNTVETTKTSLQQEANYIVTELQRVHRQAECYILFIEQDNINIMENCDLESGNISDSRTVSEKYMFRKTPELESLIYQVFPHGENSSYNDEIVVLEKINGTDVNKNYGELPLDLLFYDEEKNLSVVVPTVLTRYYNKEENNEANNE